MVLPVWGGGQVPMLYTRMIGRMITLAFSFTGSSQVQCFCVFVEVLRRLNHKASAERFPGNEGCEPFGIRCFTGH